MIKKRSVPEKISSVSDCVHMSLTAFRVLSYRITDIVTTMLGISIVDMGVLGCVISVLTKAACHRARLPARGFGRFAGLAYAQFHCGSIAFSCFCKVCWVSKCAISLRIYVISQALYESAGRRGCIRALEHGSARSTEPT